VELRGLFMSLARFLVRAFTAGLLAFSLATSWAAPSEASAVPKTLTGHLLAGSNNHETFGALVTHTMLNGGSIREKVIINGKYGYALATIGVYQYPVSTNDDGKQWRVAAGTFVNLVSTSGMGAGGTATNIAMLSRKIAVAFRDGHILGPISNIYVTTDSGRRWYVTALPGTVQGVGYAIGGPNNSTLTAIFESVHSSPPGTIHRYESLDAGKRWLLR
jgi:hypothetical protein